MKIIKTLLTFILMASLGAGVVTPAFAYEVQQLDNVSVEEDFTLGPGKVEAFLNPGEQTTRHLTITNRLGQDMNFQVDVEDFVGSPTGHRAAVLLGEETSPYSLRDFLDFELEEFTLSHGERMVLPVTVSIPEGAEPQGLYGSVLISTTSVETEGTDEDMTEGQIQLIPRIGSLFFVRVLGEVHQEGSLVDFDTVDSKKHYQSGPTPFLITYENTGSVHLNPYGFIEIKNILGRTVGQIEVEPYFAMPDSLRLREVAWDSGFGLGYYTAELNLNRGYDNIVDSGNVSFWIIPWRIIVMTLLALIVLILLVRWIAVNFELRRKD